MHVNSIKLSLTKSRYLRKIVACVVFLRFMYAIVCSTMKIIIKEIKIKAMFKNNVEINCMLKKLTNVAQLFVRQRINIIIVNVSNERARFFNICEAIFINIESIIVSVFNFVVKYFNHEFFLKRFFFQRAARMSFVNMNNKFFKMMLHFLNDEKRMNFLKKLTKHISNEKEDFVFIVYSLNV